MRSVKTRVHRQPAAIDECGLLLSAATAKGPVYCLKVPVQGHYSIRPEGQMHGLYDKKLISSSLSSSPTTIEGSGKDDRRGCVARGRLCVSRDLRCHKSHVHGRDHSPWVSAFAFVPLSSRSRSWSSHGDPSGPDLPSDFPSAPWWRWKRQHLCLSLSGAAAVPKQCPRTALHDVR